MTNGTLILLSLNITEIIDASKYWVRDDGDSIKDSLCMGIFYDDVKLMYINDKTKIIPGSYKSC